MGRQREDEEFVTITPKDIEKWKKQVDAWMGEIGVSGEGLEASILRMELTNLLITHEKLILGGETTPSVLRQTISDMTTKAGTLLQAFAQRKK